jgi:hypothetical protein
VNVSADDRICVGVVKYLHDAEQAVLAAVRGARVVALGRAGRSVLDQLCDDLRKLGPLEHITSALPPQPKLSDEQRALLHLLMDGASLGNAAKELHAQLEDEVVDVFGPASSDPVRAGDLGLRARRRILEDQSIGLRSVHRTI